MRKILTLISTSAFLIVIPHGLYAGVTLSITPNVGIPAAAQTVYDANVQGLQNSINDAYKTSSQSILQDYLAANANAQSMSNKGLGFDYTSNRSLFVVGSSFGLGGNLGGQSFSDFMATMNGNNGLPRIGIATQFNAMLGLSLSNFNVPKVGPIDLKRLTLFVNFLGINLDQIKPFTMKTNAFGLHAQYRVIEAKSFAFGIFNWTGLDIGTGFDISKNSIGMSKSFPGISSGSLTWNPTGSMSLQSSSFSIPVEVSTGVRLLYILTLFGGVGADLQFSSAKVNASLTGSVDAALPGGGTQTNAATGTLIFEETKNGMVVGYRAFGGFALNLVPLKNTNVLSVFALANVGNTGFGMNVGVRAAW